MKGKLLALARNKLFWAALLGAGSSYLAGEHDALGTLVKGLLPLLTN
jgi:hypothetical protein